jgi:hypothetical protein
MSMSLTTEDLQAIRLIVREEVKSEVKTELTPIDNRLKGVESDVREIYDILITNNIQVV